MPELEQKERMHLMREMVRDHNVYYWAARMLMDAAQLRKRARVESLIAQTESEEAKSNVITIAPGKRRTVS
jgi:trehalose 6-phosphate synthase